MTIYRNNRVTPFKTMHSAMDGLALCVLTIVLLAFSSVTFAEDWSFDLPQAEVNPIEIRLGTTYVDFVSTKQVAFIAHAPAPGWLRANRLELGIGAISQSEESRPFVSVGPVWQWNPATVNKRWYIDFGISPTVLGGARIHSIARSPHPSNHRGTYPDNSAKLETHLLRMS